MRKVLFRGKRSDNGAWESGSLVITCPGCSCEEVFITDKMTGYHTPVDPETVGQYAFLNDIDDKKIFTGDILQDKNTRDLYVVDFIGGGFGLFSIGEYHDFKYNRSVVLWNGLSELQNSCFVMQNLRVIGNIHESNQKDGAKQ